MNSINERNLAIVLAFIKPVDVLMWASLKGEAEKWERIEPSGVRGTMNAHAELRPYEPIPHLVSAGVQEILTILSKRDDALDVLVDGQPVAGALMNWNNFIRV
jgi:hypothetical protein